ncbi:hypothetical protein LV457_19540 [Mycobacterium sp. MYCO198283]|uniref:hypothetical protein n=1 Tax=Mycobacterium sp. MYCO198283 TaxID=2883505 RepID=UPI001E3971B7|nr:hypothetical protein [Mycobacterium sp. MYCO198283]MCG5434469.1 hypothetical protein [Mycobacterium sp. MYCO198283]
MGRRRRPPRRAGAPPPLPAARRIEVGPDGDDYEVRAVAGSRATKTYRCPGCDHEIRPGVAHLVAWPADRAPDDRRHWHTPCWANRETRRPTRRWS